MTTKRCFQWTNLERGIVALFLVTAWLVAWAGPAAAGEPLYMVTKYEDIAYGTDPDNLSWRLDIYQPTELDHAPVLLFIRGSGWTESEHEDRSMYNALGTTFAEYYGLTTVVADYRLSPEVIHPEHVKDVAMAFAWTHENIETYGGDQQNIFLLGHSSGAHLVSLLATNTEYIQEYSLVRGNIAGVMSVSGLYNLNTIAPLYDGILETAFGSTDPDVLAEASPWTYVEQGLPPFAVFHAQTDMPSITSESIEFATKIALYRNEVTLKMLEDTGHVSEIAQITPDNPEFVTALEVVDFVATHLR